jgi:two-component system sensor histidine kinase AlgZ
MGMALGVVVGAQLLAIILALYASHSPASFSQHLSQNSLFVQWCALLSLALLCALRTLLFRLSEVAQGLLAWLIIQLVVAGCCLAGGLALGRLWPQLSSEWFLLRALGISAIVSAAMLRYLYIQHRWRQQIAAEARARLAAMQARIRPHFLFNSMNTLADLVRSSPELAEQTILDMADLYRAGMADLNQASTLAQEIELATGYLRIEQLRLGERLRLHNELHDLPANCPLPVLTLQPLVENAVYHGIEPASKAGDLWLTGQLERVHGRQHIHIEIRNTLPDQPDRKQSGHQIAQQNIQDRLHAFFLGAGRLDLSRSDGLYRVDIRFPVLDKDQINLPNS